MHINTLIYKTIEPVVEDQQHVTINEEKLIEFAKSLGAKDLELLEQSKFFILQIKRHISKKDDVIRFLFLLSSIGFSFWAKESHDKWSYYSAIKQNYVKGGFGSLLFCLLEGYRSGKFPLDGKGLAAFSKHDMLNLVKSDRVPLLYERLQILNAIGEVLVKEYDGDFMDFFSKFSKTEDLISEMVEEFPSFHDASLYKGRQVLFLKRAQMFVKDVMTCYRDCNLDTEQLTGLADYRIPQVLVSLGILSYTDALAKKVFEKEELAHHSEEEIAIRACTLSCIKKIREETGLHLRDIDVGDLLWYRAQGMPREYHLTRTTAY